MDGYVPVWWIGVMLILAVASTAEPASHPGMRPLPEPASQAMEDGPAHFVDANSGLDTNDGSRERPWKTLHRGLRDLAAGDTLYLRGGVYYEKVKVEVTGAPDRLVTIRSFPGELAVLDGGYREFFENPSNAWEPFYKGAEGEFRPTRAYPELDAPPDPRFPVFGSGVHSGAVKVLGNFGGSGERQQNAEAYIYRNVFDLRAPIHYQMPASPEETGLPSRGRIAADHGSPIWKPIVFYHNTAISDATAWRDYYGAGLASHMQNTWRRVLNNTFVQKQGLPGLHFDSSEGDLHADANLHWSYEEGPAHQGDFFERLRTDDVFARSRKIYPPGWTARDLFADPRFERYSSDWTAPLDLRLAHESPAVDTGIPLPARWTDELRVEDADAPDLGALPLGKAGWGVGIDRRIKLTGCSSSVQRPRPRRPDSRAGGRGSDGRIRQACSGWRDAVERAPRPSMRQSRPAGCGVPVPFAMPPRESLALGAQATAHLYR